MTRKNSATLDATKAKSPKKAKRYGKRTIAILDEIRRNIGKNPVKYGDNPPKPNLVLIPLEALDIESLYQRGTKAASVYKIAVDFDYRKLGIPVVALRNGKYWVIDAQQRTRAILLMNLACPGYLTSVWCELVPDTRGRADEADLFDGRNNSKPILPIERFKACWAARKPWAVDIVNDLHSKGITVKGIARPGAVPVTCIAAVKYAHNAGVLDETIQAIDSTWGLIDEAFQVTCFHPIAGVLHRNRGKVDMEHLVKTLKKFRPAGFKAFANTTDGRGRTVGIAARIVKAYNKGLGKAEQIEEVKSSDVNYKG
jgi:hypothetical protein